MTVTIRAPNGANSVSCSYAGCNAAAVVKGLCRKHYMRLRRAGDASKIRRPWDRNASESAKWKRFVRVNRDGAGAPSRAFGARLLH